MLTRFTLDPDELASASDREIQRLAREWSRYGILCHNGSCYNECDLVAIARELPQASRKIWKQLVARAWRKPTPPDWKGCIGLEDRPSAASILNNHVDLMCIEKTRKEYIAEELNMACPDIELGHLKDIDTSTAFEESHDLADKRIPAIPIQQLWAERFALPSSMTRNIVIVDRFALGDGESVNGLIRFLQQLDEVTNKKNVSIYAGFGRERMNLTESDAQNRLVSVRGRLSRGGVGDINLYLCDSRRFGQVEHDRFFKFDHMVFDVGSGVSIFNGPLAKRSSFSAKLDQSEYQNVIKELRRLCGATYPINV